MSGTASGSVAKDTGGGGRFWGLPTTPSGRWCVVLAALFFAFMIVFYALVALGVAERGNDTFAEEWPLFISIGAAGLCGVAAGAAGIFALLAKHERSFLVALATLFGLFVAVFFVGELLFPH